MKLPIFDLGKIAIYIHWPFCQSKCPYCDFNSHVSLQPIAQKQWLKAYLNALEMQKKYFYNKQIKSIFFGGGTPSMMNPEIVAQLINYCQAHNKSLSANLSIDEISLESNPSTFEVSKFQDFKQAGVNRLSIGVQSFNPENLAYLGRKHTVKEAIDALEQSYEIFPNLSFDLIIGLPHQSLQNLQADLSTALLYAKNHISLYQLTIEKGTLFYQQKVQELDEDLSLIFYQEVVTQLAKVGLERYEISNFARAGYESIHNLNYWQGGEYIGIGPSACGRVFNQQWFETKEYQQPRLWLQKALQKQNLLLENTAISMNERFEEIVMTSLRLNQTIPAYIVKLLAKEKINQLLQANLLEYVAKTKLLKTSNQGKLCLNYVLQELLT